MYAISYYVSHLSFRTEVQRTVQTKLIEPKIKEFFQSKNITRYSSIEADLQISDVDFMEIPFRYFYEVIFTNIKKENSGKVRNEVKYMVTHDRSCVSQQCKQTKIWFDEVRLNKLGVLYFIFFDTQEIIRFIKDEAIKSYQKPDYQ